MKKAVIISAFIALLPVSAFSMDPVPALITPTPAPATPEDVHAAHSQTQAAYKLVRSKVHVFNSLAMSMEMTYTNRTKYVWYNDLKSAHTQLDHLKRQTSMLTPRMAHLMTLTEITPIVQEEAEDMVDFAKTLTHNAGHIKDSGFELKYWKNRVVNELDSRTYMTLDERKLIDAIDADAKLLEKEAKAIKAHADAFLEHVSK